VARNDLNRDTGELVDRLHFVNTRAIDLTEALLLLSRADQRSFTREHADLSLIAEEVTETLLPVAEQRGVTIETSGDVTPTIGSPALLLQMTTNLVHNAIVHNLPEQGTVWVATSVSPKTVVLTVENTGEKLTPQLVSTLVEPFQRGTERIRTKHTTEPSPSPPAPLAGSASRCNYPPHHRTLADDDQGQGSVVPPADEKRKARRYRTPCHPQCIPRPGACGKAGAVPHNPPSEGRTLRMGVAT
jgi:hypothetical protein